MKTTARQNWKRNALSASLLVAAAAAGYSGLQASDALQSSETSDTSVEQPGRGGRGGFGGGNHHLQGLDLNPPEVELAPTPSATESTQSTEKVAGAEYYDGQYYGDAVSADRWGTMQVVAVIENGELVDVLIADYPRNTNESDIITRNALPTLISEAIEAQSADIDFVSRATDSSQAFVQSLESALLDAAIGIDL
ncbi:MAG TPA: FMN-binding protein [Phototrophicaceae bacterium]|nr:FMN-binding protein [Phototrophicaceae bacterium]